MAISGGLVAAVFPGKLELYIVNKPSRSKSSKIHEWRLLDTIACADAIFGPAYGQYADEPPDALIQLRLCISRRSGIQVYELELEPPFGQGEHTPELRGIWDCKPEPAADISFPRFGLSPTTLSWFDAPGKEFRPVTFISTFMAMHQHQNDSSVDSPPSLHKFWDVNMPALYSFGVRDFDEARGLIIIGNAFGELSLYDFSGSNSKELEGCFHPIKISPASGGERLPEVCARYGLVIALALTAVLSDSCPLSCRTTVSIY